MFSVTSFDKNDRKMKEFISWPGELYENDPFYIEDKRAVMLNTPARFFLVSKGNQIYGRAAALINKDIVYQNYQTGLIGFYECVDDSNIAELLFASVEDFLRDEGCTFCIGPLNGSTWYKYRLTDPDPHQPFFLDNYHKPWYTQQFKAHSFGSIASYNSSHIKSLSVSIERVEKFEKIFSQKGIRTRSINLSHFKEDIAKIYSICIEAFRNSFLYTPISQHELTAMYMSAEKYIDPRFVLLCEDTENNPLAFIFCAPNLYEKTNKSLVIKTVATSQKSRGKGLGAFLVEKMHVTAFQLGFEEIIHALMHEDNVSNKVVGDGSSIFRTYTLFGKSL